MNSAQIVRSLAMLFVIHTASWHQVAAAQTPNRKLAKAVEARLDAQPFDRQLWGVALVDAQGKLVFGRNADRLFIPASNTKLLVSVAATSMLGGDFTVKTSVYGTGPISSGVLEGDLVLFGRGDPSWGTRCFNTDTTMAGVCDRDALARFRMLADTIAARGIHTVRGAIVGDGSWFGEPLIHPFWEASDLIWWYAAPVAGLGVNDNSVDVRYRPGQSVDAPAIITMLPTWSDYTLENRTRTFGVGSSNTIEFARDDIGHRIIVTGDVSTESRGVLESIALPDPDRFAALALRAALTARGIAVLGPTVSTVDSLAYASARTSAAIAEVAGRPLRDWIFPILNTSQNWYADMLLKQLGRQFAGVGTFEAGAAVERRFLIDSVGVDSTAFAAVDGSGLAYNNLVTPHAFTQMLRYIRAHRGWDAFNPGMPQSGNTGSLKNRFLQTPIAGRVRAKTGSINRVNSLSGYVDLPDGNYLTFSVMANHHALPTRAILAQIDSVVVDFARLMERK